MDPFYSALIPDVTATARAEIVMVLSAFPESIVRRVAEAGTTVRILKPREQYFDASPALSRLALDVDSWPAPPVGLFVVEERTVYLRQWSPMTIAHEFGHAIDCALGDGVYLSGKNPDIRKAFRDARGFVTPYAATGLDEYFAVM